MRMYACFQFQRLFVVQDERQLTDESDGDQEGAVADISADDAVDCGDELRQQVSQLKKELSKVKKEKRNLHRRSVLMKSSLRAMFSNDQLHVLARGSTRGTAWSNVTIKKALQIRFACGSGGYSLLRRQHQPLPSIRTLQRKMENINFDSGLIDDIFQSLGSKVSHFTAEEKLCCLTLDEMSITSCIEYDAGSGNIIGNATLPGHEGRATHGLVFMIGGIVSRWKQVVAYYFTTNSTDGTAFVPIVMSIIERASRVGLHVCCVTSDMGSSNQAMWSGIGLATNRYFNITSITHPQDGSKRLYFLADVPHIIKNLKSSLINGNDFHLPKEVAATHNLSSRVVSVKPLHDLADFQKVLPIKLAPNLTKEKLLSNHFNKMKVSHALNVFSKSAASGIRYLVEKEGRSKDYLTTAWFVEQTNHWFDLMSSRHPVLALSQKKIEKYDEAVQFLKSFIRIFSELRIGQKGTWKPVQTGVIMSTTSVLQLQDELLSSGLPYLLTSRLTQDCLENLFSLVRLKNPVPSPMGFKEALKAICVGQFLKSPNCNESYDNDDREFAADLLLSKKVNIPPSTPELNRIEFGVGKEMSDAERNGHFHILGFLVHSLKKNEKICATCLEELESRQEEPSDIGTLTQLKEYTPGALVKVSQKVVDMMVKVELMFRGVDDKVLLSTKGVKSNLIEKANSLTQTTTFPPCHDVKSLLLSKYIDFRLDKYCKNQVMKEKSKYLDKRRTERSSRSMAMRDLVKKVK